MRFEKSIFVEVLHSLAPKDAKGLDALRTLLLIAQKIHLGGQTNLQLAMPRQNASMAVFSGFSPLALLAQLPDEARVHLDGLVEALDIYRSMTGQELEVTRVEIDDHRISDLRKIRDLCLAEGLHSAY